MAIYSEGGSKTIEDLLAELGLISQPRAAGSLISGTSALKPTITPSAPGVPTSTSPSVGGGIGALLGLVGLAGMANAQTDKLAEEQGLQYGTVQGRSTLVPQPTISQSPNVGMGDVQASNVSTSPQAYPDNEVFTPYTPAVPAPPQTSTKTDIPAIEVPPPPAPAAGVSTPAAPQLYPDNEFFAPAAQPEPPPLPVTKPQEVSPSLSTPAAPQLYPDNEAFAPYNPAAKIIEEPPLKDREPLPRQGTEPSSDPRNMQPLEGTTTDVNKFGGGGGGGSSTPTSSGATAPVVYTPSPGGTGVPDTNRNLGPVIQPSVPVVNVDPPTTTPLPAEGGGIGIERTAWKPPEAGVVAERRELPTPFDAQAKVGDVGTYIKDQGGRPTTLPDAYDPIKELGNVNTYLTGQGAGATKLPTLPEGEPGDFGTYLQGNTADVLTPDEITEQAARLREIRTGGEMSRIEAERKSAADRYSQQIGAAGTGKDAMLNDLDNALRRQIELVNASNLRSGVTTSNSNIPVERDFNPLLYNYTQQRGAYLKGIEDKINQLRLEGQITDREYGDALAALEREGGLLEQQALDDLTARERTYGEDVRGNRFNEFLGTEGLARQGRQDTFGNEATIAQLNETLRQTLADQFFRQQGLNLEAGQQGFGNELALQQMNEAQRQNLADQFFRQTGLNLEAGQQNFGNQLSLNQLTELMRQSDIENNLRNRSQYADEYGMQNNLGLDLARTQDQLISGELERALSRGESNRADLAAPLQRSLLEAQQKQLTAEAQKELAQAARGGVSLSDQIDITNALTPQVIQAIKTVGDKNAKPEDKAIAGSMLGAFAQQWDSVNGAGNFQSRWGPIIETAKNPPVAAQGPGFWDWLTSLLGQPQSQGLNPTQGLVQR